MTLPALALAAGWRVLFLTATAPAVGAVLLMAIARVTGACWGSIAPPPIAMRLVVAGAALLGLSQVAVPAPPHLALWMHPLLVGTRAILGAGLLAFAGARLRGEASVTFAAVALALYAALVTPIASDWLLGHVPGHPVSAAGMMLFVEQIAGACAVALVAGHGEARFRHDMAKLMVAAALALGYLAYMDYLIIWFGNLPARVGFYVARGAFPQAGLVLAALALGLAAPIALLAPRHDTRREQAAGACVLTGLLLFNLWWVGGGAAAAAIAVLLLAALAAAATWRHRREVAHG